MRRDTKSALLLSVVSIIICCTMLLGTTMAWFTDSVTSASNIIKAGNLDVEMYWLDGKSDPLATNASWEDASKGAIFNYSLWEPGYTEVRHIKISNVGTLALKYELKIIANGEVSKLADVIDVYYTDPATNITDRTQLTDANKIGTLTNVLANLSTTATGNLEAGKDVTITLALKMQESAGNEYQGLSIGSDFSIQLLATQFTYENDSFDDQYDATAPYVEVSTEEEIVKALTGGNSARLSNNVTLDDGASITIPAGANAEIDLNGHTITNPVVGAPALINNGTLTITGNGSVVNGVNSTKASHTIVNNGTLTIESGNIGTDDTAGAAVVNYGTTTINGGTFASKQENTKADGLCAYAFINHSGTMTINNATLNGQTHGLFGAYGGTIVVNGGTYTMDGNGGLGCYVVYATGEGKVELNGGTIKANEPRNNRVFFVYDNDNHFNGDAVKTGKVVVNGATIYLNGAEQTY